MMPDVRLVRLHIAASAVVVAVFLVVVHIRHIVLLEVPEEGFLGFALPDLGRPLSLEHRRLVARAIRHRPTLLL
eukprot:7923430-Pyramimonas_sp.AAC.1